MVWPKKEYLFIEGYGKCGSTFSSGKTLFQDMGDTCVDSHKALPVIDFTGSVWIV